MKKFAIIVALMIFLVPISETFAGFGWQSSQRRIRQATMKWQKAQDELWKKFDTEMAQAERELDAKFDVSSTRMEQP